MEHITLRNKIFNITLLALLISVISFIYILYTGDGEEKIAYEAASAVAQILPGFAAMLIGAIALYAYVKLEDHNYQAELQLIKQSKKALNILDLWVSAFALDFKEGGRDNYYRFKSLLNMMSDEFEAEIYNGDILFAVFSKYGEEREKKIHQFQRLLTSISIIKTYEDDITHTPFLHEFLQSAEPIIKELEQLTCKEKIKNIYQDYDSKGYKSTMYIVLVNIMKNSGTSKW